MWMYCRIDQSGDWDLCEGTANESCAWISCREECSALRALASGGCPGVIHCLRRPWTSINSELTRLPLSLSLTNNIPYPTHREHELTQPRKFTLICVIHLIKVCAQISHPANYPLAPWLAPTSFLTSTTNYSVPHTHLQPLHKFLHSKLCTKARDTAFLSSLLCTIRSLYSLSAHAYPRHYAYTFKSNYPHHTFAIAPTKNALQIDATRAFIDDEYVYPRRAYTIIEAALPTSPPRRLAFKWIWEWGLYRWSKNVHNSRSASLRWWHKLSWIPIQARLCYIPHVN